MKLRLAALRATEPNACVAEFKCGDSQETLLAEFRIEERDGVTTASSDPDVLQAFDGTADEIRRVVGAIVAFCRVAHGQ